MRSFYIRDFRGTNNLYSRESEQPIEKNLAGYV